MVDPAAVLDYCATHTTIEAARHFNVSDSYIRRIKRAHRSAPRCAAADHDIHSGSSGAQPCLIAGDNTAWPCPVTGELIPIIPGTHRWTWEAERKALHERHQMMVEEAEREAEQREVPVDRSEPEIGVEQAELVFSSGRPEPDDANGDKEPVLEHSMEKVELRTVIIVRRYKEPWPGLLPLGVVYCAENFRFILALLLAAALIWSMSGAQTAVIFR